MFCRFFSVWIIAYPTLEPSLEDRIENIEIGGHVPPGCRALDQWNMNWNRCQTERHFLEIALPAHNFVTPSYRITVNSEACTSSTQKETISDYTLRVPIQGFSLRE